MGHSWRSVSRQHLRKLQTSFWELTELNAHRVEQQTYEEKEEALTHQQHTRTTFCRPWKKQEENLKNNKVKTMFLLQIHLGTWKHMHSGGRSSVQGQPGLQYETLSHKNKQN